jgi:hypothetical protein
MSGVGTATLDAPADVHEAETSTSRDESRRRFTIAALVGVGLALIVYLWVLWDHRLDPLRTAWPQGTFSNFYDIQAHALFHGHWDVPKDSLGIEGWIVGGKEYMYFGPFPSFLRMPILAVTDALDGQLTAPSMLLAWVVTGLFSSLLLWRVRLLMRGPEVLGRAEAASYAVLLATIMSGSVLLYLAGMPWVYHEAIAWSVAMSIGALFALLGVLERPSAGRVVATGALTAAALLSRTTIGWGCVIAVILAAVWFAVGRGGKKNRRWWLPLLAAGLIPLAVGCAINWIKFGSLFGLPMAAQVWTKVDAHRRAVLAANGGSVFSPKFVPSTVWAYLQPTGLRFTSVFPFITLPSKPAAELGGVTLDVSYRTASLPASMPLLFLLGVWGIVTAFRSRSVGRARLTCIPLLAMAVATSGVLVAGYIANRYLAEFLPLLVLAGAVGAVDLLRRAGRRSRRVRLGALAIVTALGLFGLAANLAVSSTPTDGVAWGGERVRRYVELQKSISDVTGHPLDDNIVRGTELPKRAPADQLFVAGDCSGLYLSLGESRTNWIPVEYAGNAVTPLTVTFQERPTRGRFPLVTIRENQPSTVYVEIGRNDRMRFRIDDPYSYPNYVGVDVSKSVPVRVGKPYQITVIADPFLHRYAVALDDSEMVSAVLATPDRKVAPLLRRAGEGEPPLPVTVEKSRQHKAGLCERLIGAKGG